MSRFLWGVLFVVAALCACDHIISLAFFSGQYYRAQNASRSSGVAILIILATYYAIVWGMAYTLLKRNHIGRTLWAFVSVAPISALAIRALSTGVSEAILYVVAFLIAYQFLVISYVRLTETRKV